MKNTKYPVERIIQILSEAELPGRSIGLSLSQILYSKKHFENETKIQSHVLSGSKKA